MGLSFLVGKTNTPLFEASLCTHDCSIAIEDLFVCTNAPLFEASLCTHDF